MTACSSTQCPARGLCYRATQAKNALDFAPLIVETEEGPACPVFVCAHSVFEQEACCD
jgi:hypothetical protein